MESDEKAENLQQGKTSNEFSTSTLQRSIQESVCQTLENVEKCHQTDVPWEPTKSVSVLYSRTGLDAPLSFSRASRLDPRGEKLNSSDEDSSYQCASTKSTTATTTTLQNPAMRTQEILTNVVTRASNIKTDIATLKEETKACDDTNIQKDPDGVNAGVSTIPPFSGSNHICSTGIVESLVNPPYETPCTETKENSSPSSLDISSDTLAEMTSPNVLSNTGSSSANSRQTVNTTTTQIVNHPETLPMPPVLRPEEINFCRFTFLILRRAPIAVRTYFDTRHPPLQLVTDLAVNKESLSALRGRIIAAQQWKTLYPSSGYVNSRQFDVTLLILLLRYMTNVPAPVTGFEKLPVQTDDSVGADLARIKHYRNLVAHSNNAKLSEADFDNYWVDIESAIERLGGKAQLLETKTLKTSLMVEKDREILLEIQQLRAQLLDTIPQNVKEQIQDLLDLWTAEDDKFHETRASMEVFHLMESNNCVAVVGNSGAGKSAIVHHVALNMQNKGYCIVPIKVPNEILQYFNKDVDQIFVVDDPCGEGSIDFHLAKEWKRYEKDVVRCLLKSFHTRLLVTCRLSISNTIHYKDIELFQPDKCKVIDLNSKEFSLTLLEKRTIYKSHTNVDCKFEKDILNLHDCFPLLCKLISTKETFMQNPRKFLEFPYKAYFWELDLLRHHPTPYEYCALVLCTFFEKGIESCHFQKGKDDKIDKIFEVSYEECCLDQGTSRKRIKQALGGLTNVFISNEGGSYKLLHSRLTEIIASHFAKESLDILIKFAPICILEARLRNREQISESESEYFIILDDRHKDVFCERIADHIEERIYDTLFNPCFPDDQLEVLLFQKLKSNGKLNSILLTQNKIGNGAFVSYLHMMNPKDPTEYREVTPDIIDLIRSGSLEYQIIGFGNGNIPNFYENLSAKLLLEINKTSFLHWLIGAGWTNFLIHSLDVVDSESKNELFQSKKSAFLLSLTSGNLDMVKLCLKLIGPDLNSKFICFLCKQLCEKGKHSNDSCPLEGLSFITIPCITGKKNILEFLFNEGICSQNDVNAFVYFTYQSVTPLTAACKFGHIDIVKLLIEKGANVNLPDKNGNTPLIESCCNGHDQIAKVLIENGANLEERCCLDLFHYDYILDTYYDEVGKEGWSALWWACKRGHSSIVSYLLEKGASINNTNKAGKTPLWAAIQRGKFDIVALLVEKGIGVNETDRNGRTPIWWASHEGQEEILKLFIDLKGKVNICDHNDISPLYTACYRGHLDCVKLLLNHGANVNTKHSMQPSPLLGACCDKNEDLISLLIRSGANVNYTFQGLCSPLSIAAWSSCKDIMTILIKNGAEVNTTFDNGKTALIQCAFDHTKDNLDERLRYLLHDLRTADDDWFNLFHPGVQNSDLLDIISILVNCGCELNIQDNLGLTALMGVVQRNTECTKLLLENGADVNLKDKESISALHYACLAQHHEEVVLLIEYGADINARDVAGSTPLHYACNNFDEQTVDILLNNGADVNVRLYHWMTPLFYLLENVIFEKKKLLEDTIGNKNEGQNLTLKRTAAIGLNLLNHGASVKTFFLICPLLEFMLIYHLKDEKFVHCLLEKFLEETGESLFNPPMF
ncbi:uncharacterized protein LOC134228439 [Saccostrea cucullata]|uniref:uncharacterized protein LOC134228439 n=1 Tax=Saccostrea cuccullata TaxID=36930 RepID=UPI002ED5695F